MSASCGARPPDGPAPLRLERTIPLPDVKGRIDHLAWDGEHDRLFVAELDNGSVDVVDLASGRIARRIGGLGKPQGVAWLPRTHELAVASEDGTLEFFGGPGLTPAATLKLGDDADDLRVDAASGMLLAGYGSGAIAAVDPARHAVVARLPLPVHPEGFQAEGNRVYVNLPDAGAVVAGDLAKGNIVARWPTGGRRLNFPMALDAQAGTLATVFRLPARLEIMAVPSGAVRQVLPACGDSDDLYFDGRRGRIYVVCGSGAVDSFRRDGGTWAMLPRTESRPGARTGLFVPEQDRLYVAARAQGGKGAAILVYRPVP